MSHPDFPHSGSEPLPENIAARLDTHIGALHTATEALLPSPALEAKLHSALKKQALASFLQRWGSWIGRFDAPKYGVPVIALAASIGFASWIVLAPFRHLAAPAPAATAQALLGEEPPFIALQPLERIALEPQASLVATTFPRAWLAGLGMPVNPERADETVQAEMLVGANGQPLAVRISQ